LPIFDPSPEDGFGSQGDCRLMQGAVGFQRSASTVTEARQRRIHGIFDAKSLGEFLAEKFGRIRFFL